MKKVIKYSDFSPKKENIEFEIENDETAEEISDELTQEIEEDEEDDDIIKFDDFDNC
jgi:hypothetical protein